jgi:hypothetical protein
MFKTKAYISNFLASCIAVSLLLLYRSFFNVAFQPAETLALALATWLLYRFDQFADEHLQAGSVSNLKEIGPEWLKSVDGILNGLVLLLLATCSFFISVEAIQTFMLLLPLLIAYFLAIMYFPWFKGNVKSFFASGLFVFGCLVGETLFAFFQFEDLILTGIVLGAWALIFQNMCLCKSEHAHFSMEGKLNWVIFGIGASTLVFLFMAQLAGLSNSVTILFKFMMTGLAQWMAALVWPKAKRFAVDAMLLIGLTFSLLLVS